jgi:hypothetical protein
MAGFRTEINLRGLFALDHPDQHLTPRQFAIALLVTMLSAVFWWYVTGSWILLVMVGGSQLNTIWRTPAASERIGSRVGTAFFWGAICAAFWLVLKRVGLMR